MPAVVQTKSRANRVKLFRKFYRHSTPNFRCYHGSRLPPRKTYEGMWPHKIGKFLSSGIKWGAAVKEKGKVPKLLSKKLKVEPQKRKKRGPLKKTKTAKKKVVVKQLKPKKRVSFGKAKSYYKRKEETEKLYTQEARYGRPERQTGSKGDPKTTFQIDPQGRLVQISRKKRKVIIA